MTSAAAVSNLVGLLGLRSPHELERLSAQYPQHSALFRPGTTLGGSSGGARDKALVELALSGLRLVDPLIGPAIQKLLRRQRTANIWEFAGQLLGTLGSGGALAGLLGPAAAGPKTLASAIVAFAGAALALMVRFLRRDIGGAENAVLKQYTELRDAGWQARILITKLSFVAQGRIDEDEAALVQQADELAARVYALLTDLGISVTPVAPEHS